MLPLSVRNTLHLFIDGAGSLETKGLRIMIADLQEHISILTELFAFQSKSCLQIRARRYRADNERWEIRQRQKRIGFSM